MECEGDTPVLQGPVMRKKMRLGSQTTMGQILTVGKVGRCTGRLGGLTSTREREPR